MGKRQSFQQVVLGKPDSCTKVNETRTYFHTTHKNKFKMLKDLKMREDTIKLLEENIGKTLSDIININVFLHQTPKAKEIETKINQWNLDKLTSFCAAKETIKKKKKATYGMGKNTCNLWNGRKYLQTIKKKTTYGMGENI